VAGTLPARVRYNNKQCMCNKNMMCCASWAAVVTTRAALSQIRVKMMIGAQAEFEITN